MTGGQRSLHSTRSFAAGPFEFTVVTTTLEDREAIESLFRDLSAAESPPDQVASFELKRDPSERSWSLSGPRLEQQPPMPFRSALVRLMSAINICALDADPGHLHLHAAAAAREGRAVVIAAERNTGKTTTVAHLVARGWSFVTDEMVRLSGDGVHIEGFPKPLEIKPGGQRLVAHLEPWLTPPLDKGVEDFSFAPIGASGASVAPGGQVHLLILLRRPPEGADPLVPSTRSLHAADAVVALMQETLDAERFGPSAHRLATLAARTRCHELTIGTPEATAAQIESLFQADLSAPALPVDLLPPSDAVAAEVATILIGDRVVLHAQRTGQVLALDSAGAQVWKHVGGWEPSAEIDVDGPVLRQFMAQLRGLRLLREAA